MQLHWSGLSRNADLRADRSERQLPALLQMFCVASNGRYQKKFTTGFRDERPTKFSWDFTQHVPKFGYRSFGIFAFVNKDCELYSDYHIPINRRIKKGSFPMIARWIPQLLVTV